MMGGAVLYRPDGWAKGSGQLIRRSQPDPVKPILFLMPRDCLLAFDAATEGAWPRWL